MSSSRVSTAGIRAPEAGTARVVRAALLVLFTYVFLANAWMGDDAHITFRTAWNLVHGYGATYNPDERVQAITDPLWMFVVAAAHFVTREFLFTVTALSWIFNVLAGVLLLRRAPSIRHAVLLVVWLLSSKALVDYTSSGLEYPLSYCLLALFYVRYLDRPAQTPLTDREIRFFVLVASLAFVNRVDSAILFALPLAVMLLHTVRARGARIGVPAGIAALPAIAWLLFATFYYGFPLPNTYYAKVANGIPSWLLRQQGFAYLLNSINFDPITIGTIALAALVAWRMSSGARLATVSALLYVAYTISVGGDFMSGRFFAMPFLVAVATVAPAIPLELTPWMGAGLVLYNLFVPLAPVKTTAKYEAGWEWRTQNGIKDERGITHRESNLLRFAPFATLPDTPFGVDGESFSASERHSMEYCCIGLFGLRAGPTKHVVDENALADPLLARLPVSPRLYFDFWTSHYFRDIPEGYIESTEKNENLLTDPMLHDYYEKLRNVTRGPLMRGSRLRDIWALNTRYRRLHQDYDKRRPIALSIRADHSRFRTGVGRHDNAAGTIRSTGQAGYLQYGPGIPLAPRFYRARWTGSVEEAPGGQVGFVEIWDGDTRLERHPVVFQGTTQGVIAQLDFTLRKPARAIDYRFFVNPGTRMTLQRVELFSDVRLPEN